MKTKRFLFLTGLFFLISQTFLYSAAGKVKKEKVEEDMNLFEIDRLIRGTDYDEALKQLKIYIENNPDGFDLAQTRIKRIMNARRNYSILAEKLIEIIKTDPGNNKEIYEITSQLEKFEKNPSDENLKFIADVKKSAEFNYFRALFLQLQEESAELVAQQKYVDAAAKIKEGFWLYQDSFYEEWKDHPEIIEGTDAIIQKIEQLYGQFTDNGYQKKITDAVNAFVKSVENGNYNDSLAKYRQCVEQFTVLADLIKDFSDSTASLQKMFDESQKINPDLTDASYIPFMTRFISGVASVNNSGISGALKCEWRNLIAMMDNAVAAHIEKQCVIYDGEFGKSVFEYARTQKSNNINTAKQSLNNDFQLVLKIAELDNKVYEKTNIQNSIASAQYVDFLAEKILNINQVAQNFEKEKKYTGTEEIIPVIAKIYSVTGKKSDYAISGKKEYEEYKLQKLTNWDSFTEKYNGYVDELFTEVSSFSFEGWEKLRGYYEEENESVVREVVEKCRIAEIVEKGLEKNLSKETHKNYLNKPQMCFEDLSERGNDKKSGTVLDSENGEIIYNYPDICVALADKISSDIEINLKNLAVQKKNLIENNKKYRVQENDEDSDRVVEVIVGYFDDAEKNLKVQNDLNKALRERNRSLIIDSQVAKNEADFRFTEAEQALKKEQFDLARKKLQEALSKYDESLSVQNDLELRNECDEKLFALGNKITKAENEIVVKEVRMLKTQAKDAYFNGRFEDAEKLLNQAKLRWAVTNVEEDEEIKNLQNYVNTAISMQTGREILPSAPLYPEMSQLLNIAYHYYDEGNKKIDAKQKEEAEKDFDVALENLQKLQYVYPINQEASILTLKINRLRNPEKFNEEFDQKVSLAKSMVKNKETQQEGYANLLDYLALEPNNQKLKDIVYQVEVDIGIRQKKVANTEQKRSNDLVKESQNLFNKAGNDVNKLKNALAKINQAIKLNPDNETAMILKDKITTKIGGNTVTVLSTEDENLYQMAVKKLQNNDIIGANAIAIQLLKKPQNGSIKKVKDLKNKIDAKL